MRLERQPAGAERTAIFIDGWNFAKATYEGLSIRVDFKRLLATLAAGRLLLRATYYIGEWTDEGYALLASLRRARLVEGTAPVDPQETARNSKVSSGCSTATAIKSSSAPSAFLRTVARKPRLASTLPSICFLW